MVELVYKFDEKSYCKGESIVKYDSKFFSSTHTHIYMDTSPPPLSLRVWGNDMHDQYINIQHSDDPTSGFTILYGVNKH